MIDLVYFISIIKQILLFVIFGHYVSLPIKQQTKIILLNNKKNANKKICNYTICIFFHYLPLDFNINIK